MRHNSKGSIVGHLAAVPDRLGGDGQLCPAVVAVARWDLLCQLESEADGLAKLKGASPEQQTEIDSLIAELRKLRSEIQAR